LNKGHGGPDGLFHCDARFLSRLKLTINQLQPLLLGSNVRDAAVTLISPESFAVAATGSTELNCSIRKPITHGWRDGRSADKRPKAPWR
jgi:hypothetical protein